MVVGGRGRRSHLDDPRALISPIKSKTPVPSRQNNRVNIFALYLPVSDLVAGTVLQFQKRDLLPIVAILFNGLGQFLVLFRCP